MVSDGSMEILKTLSNTASIIAEGEILELTTSRDIEISEAVYLDVIKSKTAQLFSSACEVGAIISDQSHKDRDALKNFGLNLGKAFQIIDDVLAEATLRRPENIHMTSGGREGIHTEHLGHLLSDMQYLQRAYPDAKW